MTGEASIVVVCACGKKLKAPTTSAGKKARCPACGAMLVLSAKAAAAPMPARAAAGVRPAPMPISVSRPARSAASVSAAAPVAIAAPPPDCTSDFTAPPSSGDDGLDGLYELAEQANAAAPVAPGARCPQCGAAMEQGAVLCTNCGYDTRTGKALATQSAAAGAKPKAVPYASKRTRTAADMMAPDGSLFVGLAYSIAFALAASILWIAIALVTGYSIGYIAALIGIAAGVGMRQGQRGANELGGWLAVATTVVAIFVAKLAVLEVVILRVNPRASIFQISSDHLMHYFFSPKGTVIIVVGLFAAYRTGNGSR